MTKDRQSHSSEGLGSSERRGDMGEQGLDEEGRVKSQLVSSKVLACSKYNYADNDFA